MLYDEIVGLYKKFRLTHYRNIFGKVGEKPGSLSATEAFSVDSIYLLGTPTIKEFSDFLGISQPNATYKINSLVEKGYVTKEPSAEDRREYLLHVTDKFYSYLDRRSHSIVDAVEKVEKDYTPQELELLGKMLRALIEAVE